MTSDGIEFELTQREFMRLINMHKRVLKENDLTAETYVFDDFVHDVFALFLNSLKDIDVEMLNIAGT